MTDPMRRARVVQHGNNLLAELPRRNRRAEAGYELFGLHAHGVRVGVGPRVANSGAKDHLLRHDRLEADPEAILLRNTVGIFGHVSASRTLRH